MPTKIEWATETWNPITGCTPASEGCQHCYARRMATRLRGRCGYPADDPFRATFHPDRLGQPLKWKKPRMIFVCSMGDLFHEHVSIANGCQVLGAAKDAPQHKYLFLTKRPEIMMEAMRFFWGKKPMPKNWWCGITAENQQRADERIPILLQIPAAVRFVSVEPILERVNLAKYLGERDSFTRLPQEQGCSRSLQWCIVGGESGPGARPMHPDWARSLRDQCQSAGVPFFFKQWGAWRAGESKDFGKYPDDTSTGQYMVRVGKKAAGRLLDGREWNGMPMVEESTK